MDHGITLDNIDDIIFMKYVFLALIANSSLILFANNHNEYKTLNFDKTKITTTLVKCDKH